AASAADVSRRSYTALFRSDRGTRDRGDRQQLGPVPRLVGGVALTVDDRLELGGDVGIVVEAEHRIGLGQVVGQLGAVPLGHAARSEEHTSELQSREKLVCR